MLLTSKIEKAIVRSAQLHRHQNRKAGGAPYIVHPYAVAFLLAHYSEDEDVICAALLHDVLEDVPSYGAERMQAEFGERVYRIVKEVTEDHQPLKRRGWFMPSHQKRSWKERKEQYIERLKDDSKEGLMIATADKIHNLRSLIDSYALEGEMIWKSFPAGRAETFWFYHTVLGVIRDHLAHPLVEELASVLEEADRRIPNPASSPSGPDTPPVTQ